MRSLRQFVGQEITWSQAPGNSRHYEVKAGNTTVATLDMGRPATAMVAEGRFIIKEHGALRKQVSVYTSENGPAVETYTKMWGTRAYRRGDGRMLQWGNPMGANGGWQDMSGALLVHVRKRSMTINPQAATLPDLAVLVMLGLYLTLR